MSDLSSEAVLRSAQPPSRSSVGSSPVTHWGAGETPDGQREKVHHSSVSLSNEVLETLSAKWISHSRSGTQDFKYIYYVVLFLTAK